MTAVPSNRLPSGDSGQVVAGRWSLAIESTVVVAEQQERIGSGLRHWIDGTIGFATWRGRRIAVAPNGPVCAVHDADGGLVAGLRDSSVVISGLAADVDHASGGPLWCLPGGEQLLLVYHGERFVDGDPSRFESYLGMAVSNDGASFEDLGPVLTPTRRADDIDDQLVDVGPGAFVVNDTEMHLFFFERGVSRADVSLGVALCDVAAVVDAVRRGTAPVFSKFVDGAFTSPALRGPASSIFESHVLWFDVIEIGDRGELLMAYSTADVVGGAPMWWIEVRSSSNGLDWSEPIRLAGTSTRDEQMYVSLDGGGPRRVEADTIELFSVRASLTDRWSNARVEQTTIRVTSLDDGSPAPAYGRTPGAAR